MSDTSPTQLPGVTFEKELKAAGFTRRRSDRNHMRNGLLFMIEESWPVLRSRLQPVSTDPLLVLMGRCGLWKCMTERGRVRRLFELPPWVIASSAGEALRPDDDGRSALEKMLSWALDTTDGNAPAGWTVPPIDEVHSMIPRHGLTVQSGTLLRQGELVHKEGRLAMRFGILHGIPEDLSEHRHHWLRRLLIDAQNRWRLVRVGFADGNPASAIQAEVDLTGAPHALLEELITVALPALRLVVGWVSAAAVFLVDGPRDCPALEVEVIEAPRGKPGGNLPDNNPI